MVFEYNTTEEKLRFPAYGRLVQEMIDRAIAESSRKTRQAMAERIVTVMADLAPQIQASPNCWQVLWNHLAFISDYKLDIDYPVEIERVDKCPPRKLSYPGNKIRFRQYGHLIEATLEKLEEIPANNRKREALLSATASRMKRCITNWKGDEIENEKVSHDIASFTNNAITPEEVLEAVKHSERMNANNRPRFTPRKKGGKFYNSNR